MYLLFIYISHRLLAKAAHGIWMRALCCSPAAAALTRCMAVSKSLHLFVTQLNACCRANSPPPVLSFREHYLQGTWSSQMKCILEGLDNYC